MFVHLPLILAQRIKVIVATLIIKDKFILGFSVLPSHVCTQNLHIPNYLEYEFSTRF